MNDAQLHSRVCCLHSAPAPIDFEHGACLYIRLTRRGKGSTNIRDCMILGGLCVCVRACVCVTERAIRSCITVCW